MSDSARQAQLQFDNIKGLVDKLDGDEDISGGEAAMQAILEDPLEVSVRSGWYAPGDSGDAEEYCILLCTGGPAVRIIGDLGEYSSPSSATLQHQDWGTTWTELRVDEDVLLRYAQCFFYGE